MCIYTCIYIHTPIYHQFLSIYVYIDIYLYLYIYIDIDIYIINVEPL